MNPFTSPETIYLLLGENYKHKTQFLWLSIVCMGVSVSISHSLIVESPDPLAQFLPSGEN